MYQNHIFWFKYDTDRSTINSEFDAIGVQTHDSQIITVHVTSMPALTTQPSVTSFRGMYCHISLEECTATLA